MLIMKSLSVKAEETGIVGEEIRSLSGALYAGETVR
jgi:hypothetical protein